MNRLKKIQHNCRKATLLIEKQQFGKIGFREKIELRIHLAGCSVCKLFEKQSAVISQAMRDVIGRRNQHPALTANDKRSMQETVERALRKNNL